MLSNYCSAAFFFAQKSRQARHISLCRTCRFAFTMFFCFLLSARTGPGYSRNDSSIFCLCCHRKWTGGHSKRRSNGNWRFPVAWYPPDVPTTIPSCTVPNKISSAFLFSAGLLSRHNSDIVWQLLYQFVPLYRSLPERKPTTVQHFLLSNRPLTL